MRRTAVFAYVLLAISSACRQSRAESALVVLVRPATQSDIVSEAMTRIRGELIADGFEVAIVDPPPGADPRIVLSRADQSTGASATIGLFLHADAKAAELWVVDRLTTKTVVRSVEMTKSSSVSLPEVLARRSVELLRASLLEILVDTNQRALASPTPRAQASRWAANALEPRPSSLSVEAGAQVLAGFGGWGGAVMPVGRARIDLGQRLAARLTLSGLGTRPRIETSEGSATVNQAMGLLELVGELAPQSSLRPFVTLGAGTYRIGVDASAASPYEGHDDSFFAFAADAGGGFSLALSSSFALSFEGHAVMVTPYPVIRFLQVNTAEMRNPLLAGALTFVGRL
jgi:hypothetical protein